jgi:anti-sigma regulatory factor (Ser/Thr protein kinase)
MEAQIDLTVAGELGTPADFRHVALFYSSEEEYAAAVLPFVLEGLAADEAVLVATDARKSALIRSALHDQAERVAFADMSLLGHNPARIIPAWRAFLDGSRTAGKGVRGIGEPVWAERTAAELAECQRHESLLNVAFEDSGTWSLMCPYDTSSLGPEVIEEARRSHPYLLADGAETLSLQAMGRDMAAAHLNAPLPQPGGDVLDRAPYSADRLAAVRGRVDEAAARAGMNADARFDLCVAANEVASNSVQHGGGRGDLAVWRDAEYLVCEFRDLGRIHDPLVGRCAPAVDSERRRGLWMANQLCDLVQIRDHGGQTVIRLHKRIG